MNTDTTRKIARKLSRVTMCLLWIWMCYSILVSNMQTFMKISCSIPFGASIYDDLRFIFGLKPEEE